MCVGCLDQGDVSTYRRRQTNLSLPWVTDGGPSSQGSEGDRGPALTWWVRRGHVTSHPGSHRLPQPSSPDCSKIIMLHTVYTNQVKCWEEITLDRVPRTSNSFHITCSNLIQTTTTPKSSTECEERAVLVLCQRRLYIVAQRYLLKLACKQAIANNLLVIWLSSPSNSSCS